MPYNNADVQNESRTIFRVIPLDHKAEGNACDIYCGAVSTWPGNQLFGPKVDLIDHCPVIGAFLT